MTERAYILAKKKDDMRYKDRLPDSVEVKRLYTDADKSLREMLRAAQQGYRTLQKCPDLFLPDCLEKITEEWLQQAIDEKLRGVEQAQFLPDEEKRKIRGQWLMLQNFGGRAVRDITRLIDEVGSNNLCWDETAGIFFIKDLEKLAHARAVRMVPEDAKEHYSKICHILREVQELREWEKVRRVPTRPLIEYAQMSVEDFAGSWAQGGMTAAHEITDYGYLIV
ncbi:MAG: hypothetical protein J6X21_03655 [Bacteroidaceae bacterium]|nr:hypothetical protein [Bacteroidaceae bacterium]